MICALIGRFDCRLLHFVVMTFADKQTRSAGMQKGVATNQGDARVMSSIAGVALGHS